MRKEQIIVIAGRSGSGKSTLARALADAFDCEEIGFSYAGKELSALDRECDNFLQIEEYIYQCIMSAVARSGRVILDGLASERIYERLCQSGLSVHVMLLNTPDALRIERIAAREDCSLKEAERIEEAKARGKSMAGLEYVIGRAEVAIDGSLELSPILDTVMTYCESVEGDEDLPDS